MDNYLFGQPACPNKKGRHREKTESVFSVASWPLKLFGCGYGRRRNLFSSLPGDRRNVNQRKGSKRMGGILYSFAKCDREGVASILVKLGVYCTPNRFTCYFAKHTAVYRKRPYAYRLPRVTALYHYFRWRLVWQMFEKEKTHHERLPATTHGG